MLVAKTQLRSVEQTLTRQVQSPSKSCADRRQTRAILDLLKSAASSNAPDPEPFMATLAAPRRLSQAAVSAPKRPITTESALRAVAVRTRLQRRPRQPTPLVLTRANMPSRKSRPTCLRSLCRHRRLTWLSWQTTSCSRPTKSSTTTISLPRRQAPILVLLQVTPPKVG